MLFFVAWYPVSWKPLFQAFFFCIYFSKKEIKSGPCYRILVEALIFPGCNWLVFYGSPVSNLSLLTYLCLLLLKRFLTDSIHLGLFFFPPIQVSMSTYDMIIEVIWFTSIILLFLIWPPIFVSIFLFISCIYFSIAFLFLYHLLVYFASGRLYLQDCVVY